MSAWTVDCLLGDLVDGLGEVPVRQKGMHISGLDRFRVW